MICNDSCMIYNLANRIKKIREDYGDNPNIAALSVALRTLRSVVRVGAATT